MRNYVSNKNWGQRLDLMVKAAMSLIGVPAFHPQLASDSSFLTIQILVCNDYDFSD